jgi:hypothetical protein
LCISWAYSNGQKLPPGNSAGTELSENRITVTFSIDSTIWSEFRRMVSKQYRPRRKHPKRKPHAQLLHDAIDSALVSYVNQWKDLDQDGQKSEE